MRRLVMGVIGHVDHGKTALVRALTGTETDRLPEERRRGISIALGFAVLGLGDAEVDLVDMPGHERFVRTMVSGATGIGAALLVVAANEGVMPQTREHVDIAGLLGVRRAVIAISKAELVPPDQAAAAGREAAKLAAAAGLQAGAPVPVSALTGLGLDTLTAAIAVLLDGTVPPEDAGLPWLPIDRAFSVPGHGTVVTGTLRRGMLSVGDEIEILPGGAPARVRGLQVHGTRVVQVAPGQRAAVNLRGVEPAQVSRGAALAAREALPASTWLTAVLRATADAPPLRTGMALNLLLGTDETEVRLRLLDRDELLPGQTAPAQLRCARPVCCPARERFILRVPSPALTVAGGLVLDPAATRLRRHAAAVIERLQALAGSDASATVAGELERAGSLGVGLDRLVQLTGLAPARVAALAQDCDAVMGRGRVAVAGAAFATVLAQVPRVLAAHETSYPEGVPRERLPALLPGVAAPVLDHALERLMAAGTLRQAGGAVALLRPDQERARAAQDATLTALISETLRRAGLSTPDLSQIAGDRMARRALDALVRQGLVVRVVDRVQKREVLFHRDAVDAARRCLAPLLSKGPGLLVAEAGAALGISRKYSVPLLEYLDATGFTRRVADRRVLGRAG